MNTRFKILYQESIYGDYIYLMIKVSYKNWFGKIKYKFINTNISIHTQDLGKFNSDKEILKYLIDKFSKQRKESLLLRKIKRADSIIG